MRSPTDSSVTLPFFDMLQITRSGLSRYLENTSWLMAERMVRLVASLVVGIYVARYLGPQNFGLLSYAASFVALFGALANLGLDGVLVRELVRGEEPQASLLGTALILKLAGALLALFLIGAATVLAGNDVYTNTLILIIAAVLVFQTISTVDLFFQSRVLAKYVVRVQLLQVAISSALKIVLVLAHASLIWFAVVMLFDAILMALGLIVIYKQRGFSLEGWRFEPRIARALLASAWPLVLAGAAVSIYMRIDQVMIKQMLGSAEVGLYAAATRLSEVCYLIPTVISASVFPAIINARRISTELYLGRLQNLFSLLTWSAIGIAIPTTFVAIPLVRVLFGEDFVGAGDVLAIHIWASVFVFLGVASSQYLLAEDLTKVQLYRTVSGAIVNVMLNLILIPDYGIRGAAWATVMSQVVATFLIVLHARGRVACAMMLKSFILVRARST